MGSEILSFAFKCRYCTTEKRFRTYENLIKHYNTKHEVVNCTICNITTISNSDNDYATHIGSQVHHNNVRFRERASIQRDMVLIIYLIISI